MSAPRTKRQFAGAASDPAQRQIRDFFKPSQNGPASPSDYATAASLSPALPGPVQSSLLNVGMRVRKAVPEGYKNGNSFGAFSLWIDTPASSDQQSPHDFQTTAGTAPGGRELLPFCGINKVGGLAAQPETYTPIPAALFTPSTSERPTISIQRPSIPDLGDVPGLTSSQDSITSTDSNPPQALPSQHLTANNKKRTYTEETATLPVPISNGGIVWRNRGEWLDGEVSPRSRVPLGWEKNDRVMAVPRGARKAAPAIGGADGLRLTGLGQENMAVDLTVGAVDDFEEAEFLDHRLVAGEMDVEYDER